MGTLVVGLAACNGPTTIAPPEGGRPVDLDYAFFATSVEPVLVSRDCTRTAGCHGGQGAGQLLLSGGADPQADFTAVRPHTRPWDPPTSPLLLKPLAVASGGSVHQGGLAGKITLQMDITAAGAVTNLALVDDSMGIAALERCILSQVEG